MPELAELAGAKALRTCNIANMHKPSQHVSPGWARLWCHMWTVAIVDAKCKVQSERKGTAPPRCCSFALLMGTTLDGPPHCFTEDGAAVIQARRMIEYVVMHALEELDVPLDLVHRHRELRSSRHFRCGLGREASVLFSWCGKWWCFLLDYNLLLLEFQTARTQCMCTV